MFTYSLWIDALPDLCRIAPGDFFLDIDQPTGGVSMLNHSGKKNVFIDQYNIKVGQNWATVITEKLVHRLKIN